MRLRTQLTPYFLILPALLILLFLFVYPIVWNGWLSLHNVSFGNFSQTWDNVGLKNYQAVLQDTIFPGKFIDSLLVSLKFVGGSVTGQFLLGLTLAMVLNRRIPGRNLFRVLIALPWILSELVVAYIWLYLYQPFGTVNNVLGVFGIEPVRWLGSTGSAIWALVVTNVWFGTPFTMLTMGSALTTINPQLHDAAAVDGATNWQRFRHVTWPLIAPFAALNLILITMWTVNLFALPLAMTNGGPLYATTTTSLYMYRHAFEFGNFSVGSSIGVMLFLLNVVAAAFYVRMLRSSN